MNAPSMARPDDGPPRLIVTFWPGRPKKSQPGTIYPLAGPVDPERQARELVRLWREFRRKGVLLEFPVVAKRSPWVPRLIARVRGHARHSRVRRRTRRRSSSSRGSPDDDGDGERSCPRRVVSCSRRRP